MLVSFVGLSAPDVQATFLDGVRARGGHRGVQEQRQAAAQHQGIHHPLPQNQLQQGRGHVPATAALCRHLEARLNGEAVEDGKSHDEEVSRAVELGDLRDGDADGRDQAGGATQGAADDGQGYRCDERPDPAHETQQDEPKGGHLDHVPAPDFGGADDADGGAAAAEADRGRRERREDRAERLHAEPPPRRRGPRQGRPSDPAHGIVRTEAFPGRRHGGRQHDQEGLPREHGLPQAEEKWREAHPGCLGGQRVPVEAAVEGRGLAPVSKAAGGFPDDGGDSPREEGGEDDRVGLRVGEPSQPPARPVLARPPSQRAHVLAKEKNAGHLHRANLGAVQDSLERGGEGGEADGEDGRREGDGGQEPRKAPRQPRGAEEELRGARRNERALDLAC
mmetsp:Transcript_17947/g.36915  ORF Transcript_17947/g.36915 Transcript_17947/m.36915 type:complete len:392 (-) Transcript_17947:612-1787(-)